MTEEIEFLKELALTIGKRLVANFEELASSWRALADTSATEPVFAAVLVGLALLAGIAGRQVSLMLGALLAAALTLALIPYGETTREMTFAIGVFAQLLFLGAGTFHRREFGSLRQRTFELESERTRLQGLLDREILWRTAADECPKR